MPRSIGSRVVSRSRRSGRGTDAWRCVEQEEYTLMDDAEATMWWYRALHARLLDALTARPGPILDAGCGTGGLLARLAGRADAVGLEWNHDAARRAAGKSGLPVAQGGIAAMPFAAASFGTVIAADVLCHAAVEPAAALVEVRRVLRPGGRLIVNMPAYRWMMSVHDDRVHNARRQTAGQTRAMLVGAGFAIVAIGYWNSLLLPLMIAHRKFSARSHPRSDVAVFSPWRDRILHGMTELERHLPFRLPAAGSILAIAERPTEPK